MALNTYNITPIPAPRLTKGSLWTPQAKRYAEWKAEIKRLGVTIPESSAHITFNMPIPTGKKKYRERIGTPHRQRPDLDNLCKSLFDALFDDDAHIWDVRLTKTWAEQGSITVISPA